VLVDDGIGVRIIRKADGGRRPKIIWEISAIGFSILGIN